jgi:Arm DNA-binding domain
VVSNENLSWTYSGFKTREEAEEWLVEVSKLYPTANTGVEQEKSGFWQGWLVFSKTPNKI